MAGFACGNTNGFWPKLVIEIIDHAPVVGLLLAAGMTGNDILYNGALARSFQPRDEDVVPRLIHIQSEVDGAHGAFLADHLIQRLDLGCTGEIENRRITDFPQLRNR